MSVTELAAQYARSRDPRSRDEIVAACTPLIQRMAAEFVAQGAPRDDLIQVGYLGLLHAIEGFDPARGLKFDTYARPVIRGEMRHYFRDHHGTIRRPRWLWKINRQIELVVQRYVGERGRLPRFEELAVLLNISDEGLREILRAREAVRTTALVTDEGESLEINRRLIRRRAYASFQLPIEDRITLFEAVERLTLLQRKVLYCLFFRDLSQTQAARIVGIPQRQISRVLAGALTTLRTLLA